jgi:hypothetical protein
MAKKRILCRVYGLVLLAFSYAFLASGLAENDTPSAFPEGSSSVIESLTWRLAGSDPAALREQVRALVSQIARAVLIKDTEGTLTVSVPTSELAALSQKLTKLGQLSGPETDAQPSAPTTLLRVLFVQQ